MVLVGLSAGTETPDGEEDPSIQLRPGYQADQLFLARMQCVDAADQFAASGESLVAKLQSLQSEWENSLRMRMQCTDAAAQLAASGSDLIGKLQSLQGEWENSLQAELCLPRAGWEVQVLMGLMGSLYLAMLGLVIVISCRARRPIPVPAAPSRNRAADLRRSDEAYPMTLRCRRPRALELPKLQVPAGGTAV